MGNIPEVGGLSWSFIECNEAKRTPTLVFRVGQDGGDILFRSWMFSSIRPEHNGVVVELGGEFVDVVLFGDQPGTFRGCIRVEASSCGTMCHMTHGGSILVGSG